MLRGISIYGPNAGLNHADQGVRDRAGTFCESAIVGDKVAASPGRSTRDQVAASSLALSVGDFHRIAQWAEASCWPIMSSGLCSTVPGDIVRHFGLTMLFILLWRITPL